MKKPEIRKFVRLSWVREQAKQEFVEIRSNPNIDSTFFTDMELEHYIWVLIRRHEADWLVIDDLGNERVI